MSNDAAGGEDGSSDDTPKTDDDDARRPQMTMAEDSTGAGHPDRAYWKGVAPLALAAFAVVLAIAAIAVGAGAEKRADDLARGMEDAAVAVSEDAAMGDDMAVAGDTDGGMAMGDDMMGMAGMGGMAMGDLFGGMGEWADPEAGGFTPRDILAAFMLMAILAGGDDMGWADDMAGGGMDPFGSDGRKKPAGGLCDEIAHAEDMNGWTDPAEGMRPSDICRSWPWE